MFGRRRIIKYFIRRRRVRRAPGRRQYLQHKETARGLIEQRVAYFNERGNFVVGRISVRNQRTRWGSCSRRGNLNFNYKIALIPERLADYVIVHELCHLQEFNHSRNFWSLVAEILPDYLERRQELKKLAISGVLALS